ncbi:MAG TPA: Rne/Rng family ribonuclease [Cellulomonas sp.]|uniref:Rne/Rng family ribonuclease n=1 Tax=Cellulomonas sp. TaxID=40001 RepID=UPI002E3083A3|nr:Rne/Rng family ribonuclease [Cellulomonas sp.]HEX5332303.1 Rne/Rng family ribonuclease [Cellulomonas sp.]
MTFENTSDNAVETSAESTGVAAVAPSKPARRRATRRTAAPDDVVAAPVTAAPSAAESVPVAAPEPEPVVAPSVEPAPSAAAEPAAPPARRSRRVTRPVVTPVGAVEAPSVPAAAPVAENPVAETPADEAPVVAARKRAPRRSRSQAAPLVEPVVEAIADEEEIDEAAPVAAAAPSRAPALDVFAALAATPPVEAAPAATRSTTPRLATTALLFQAPEPDARPRRRRAVSAAGTPAAISEAAAALHEEEVAASAAVTEAVVPDEVVQTEAPARRRSRRGGRGQAPVEVQDVVAPAEQADEDELDEDQAHDEATVEQDDEQTSPRRRRRRGGRGRRSRPAGEVDESDEGDEDEESTSALADEDGSEAESDDTETATEGDGDGGSSRRRRRRRRGGRGGDGAEEVVTTTRTRAARVPSDEPTALRGSTRLEAKRQRRREGRDNGRRRQIITESEFLARRESVDRTMIVREANGRTQIAVLEDGVLVEHFVSRQAQASMAGNVYLGRVQNVLPSMEAAFVDVGKGRNAVLYAGEVNWDAAGLEGQPRRIEQALKSGDAVLVQVTKDPIGHKGARLTSQVTLAGRYLVYVPGGGMTGISRKLPDTERNRLKKLLRELVPDSAGVIVRTAAEGASEEELRADIARLQAQWEAIEKKAKSASAPALLQGEPDLAIRVVRDIFNDDFGSLVVQGDEAWDTISGYIGDLAPDLASKVTRWSGRGDVFAEHRIDEQLAKGMDRKVWLPSGGSLVIDRTEAMTVVDVNTGKFTGSGGTLEETVTRNNLEAAEEIVRQLRLRDIGGIIVIDFIDMVLEQNRDLVLRRLVECLGRDRTKHQVAEVTSLGLVQMTRKRVGQGLVEAFSETCEHCNGRGFIVHAEPIEKDNRPDVGAAQPDAATDSDGEPKRARRKRVVKESSTPTIAVPVLPEARAAVKATLATIAAAAAHAHEHSHEQAPERVEETDQTVATPAPVQEAPADVESARGAAPSEPVATSFDAAVALPVDAGDGTLELVQVDPGVFELDGDEDETSD